MEKNAIKDVFEFPATNRTAYCTACEASYVLLNVSLWSCELEEITVPYLISESIRLDSMSRRLFESRLQIDIKMIGWLLD